MFRKKSSEPSECSRCEGGFPVPKLFSAIPERERVCFNVMCWIFRRPNLWRIQKLGKGSEKRKKKALAAFGRPPGLSAPCPPHPAWDPPSDPPSTYRPAPALFKLSAPALRFFLLQAMPRVLLVPVHDLKVHTNKLDRFSDFLPTP